MSVALASGGTTTPHVGRRSEADASGGCWTYIPAELLQASPLADTWPIFYRVWGGQRGRFVVTLYDRP